MALVVFNISVGCHKMVGKLPYAMTLSWQENFANFAVLHVATIILCPIISIIGITLGSIAGNRKCFMMS